MRTLHEFRRLLFSSPIAHSKDQKHSHDQAHSRQQVGKSQAFFKVIAKEDGNVESALVLIPLLVVFLIGVQIIAATNIRNTDMALAQGDAATRAISHNFQYGDEIVEVGGRIEKIQMLITHRSHTLPQLVPGLAALLGGAPATDVVGIAVVEPLNK